MSRPTALEPVKAITCTRGSRTSAAPTSPNPGSSESAPAGTPASRSACTRISADAGDCSAGFSTTALPAASAAAVIPAGIASGKFQGEITAATPRGTYCIALRSPGTWSSSGPPSSRSASRA